MLSASKHSAAIRRQRTGTASTKLKANSRYKGQAIGARYWTFASGEFMLRTSIIPALNASPSMAITADRKEMGMLVLRCAATLMVLLMVCPPGHGQDQSRTAVAPEYQDMIAKRAMERDRIAGCHRQATEQKILPRDRPQFVINCLDGGSGLSQPSVVAPEYQELAAKRAKEKERVDNCQRQATEQRVPPRDRPQFVISCLEKIAQ